MVILERLVVSITNNSHHRLHQGFTCAQVPVFEAWNQVDVKVSFLVKHVHNFVTCTSNSGRVNHIQCLKDLVHAVLIFIHRANSPHIVVLSRNAVFCWEGAQRSHSLQTAQLFWELVFDKYATLWRAEVGPPLTKLLAIKGFMNDANARSAVDSNSNHTGDMVQMTFSETFCAIKWINPDNHILFKELIRELVVIVVSLWGGHPINLLHFLKIAPVAVTLHVVVLDQHFLTDVIGVKLVGHDVRSLCAN